VAKNRPKARHEQAKPMSNFRQQRGTVGRRRKMEFRVLGPLEVAENGRVLSLGSGRQLALVGFLLLHRNEAVSTDRLVDELWAGSPPPTAGKIIRNSVSLLRKELGERLVTRSTGYLLRVEPGELDSERLERAVADGGLEQLSAALALWRGTPLTQLADQEFARHEIARLEELRLAAIEARIEAELALGRAGTVVSELEALVRAHPLRERLRALLMLALYRAGRQSDALQAYQDARRTLSSELGLEPGRQLQELERKILNQDQTLEAPARAVTAVSRRRGGLLIMLGAAVLLAAGAAAATVELTGGSGVKSLSVLAPHSVGVIDPKTNRLVADVPVGATPTRIALAGGSVWVINYGDNTVSRIDADKRVVLRTVALPGPPSGVAADDHGAWVVHLRGSRGTQSGAAGAAFVDARFNDVTRTVVLNQFFDGTNAVAVGAGAVWTDDPGFVTRIDPATGKIVALIPVAQALDKGVSIGEGSVWAIGGFGIVRIDPATNTVLATIPVAQGIAGRCPTPSAVAVGEHAVWVANEFQTFSPIGLSNKPAPKRGTVSRIDPETNAVVVTIPVGHDPFAIAVADGAVWVANRTDFTISRIDPQTNRVVATIPIGNRPEGLAAGDGAVWVSVG
jgi:YVTN family beta-propeller protein